MIQVSFVDNVWIVADAVVTGRVVVVPVVACAVGVPYVARPVAIGLLGILQKVVSLDEVPGCVSEESADFTTASDVVVA